MWNMGLDTLCRKFTGCVAVAMFLLLGFGCKKPENRTCFKSIGDTAEKTVSLPAFDRLLLREHIEYVLVQDSADKLVITGGKNLIGHIGWSIDQDGRVEIRNENKCNFLRKQNQHVKVEIHFTKLINLHFEGTHPLTNKDTLQLDYFSMLIRDGAGSVKLNLNAMVVFADISHGWGDYTLAGKTEYAKIAARSNGYCDAFNLKVTDSLEVNSETVGTIKVKADGIPLRGKIQSNGDVWYKGTPSLIDIYTKDEAKGKLIHKD